MFAISKAPFTALFKGFYEMCIICLLSLLAVSCDVAFGQALARPAPSPAKPVSGAGSFEAQQAVEVREGDAWSKATVLKKEGRKFQIRYEDGAEEWVTVDRLRGVQGGPAARAGTPATTAPAKAPKEKFSNGAKVEVKKALSWKPATIKNQDGDLYLVIFTGWESQTFWQWVHVSSIRQVGSARKGPAWGHGVSISSGGVAKAKEEAKQKFANIEDELAAEAAGKKASPFEPVPYDKPIADANLDKVDDLLPAGVPSKLAAFDPAPANARKPAERAYVLKGKGVSPSPVGPSSMLFGGGKALAAYTSGMPSDKRTVKLEVIDLVIGENAGFVAADPLSFPLDLSPSGQRLVGRANGFHSGTSNRLDVFSLKAGNVDLQHVISFVPYASSDHFWKDVEWAAFADDEHVMTCNRDGSLIFWHAPSATAKWRMKVSTSITPVLSPGRKQVAVMVEQGLAVIDPLAGRVLCLVDGGRSVSSLAFTPDGKRVVGATAAAVCTWDLEKGAALPDIGLPPKVGGYSVVALDSRFALLGGSFLLDLDKKMVVWRYGNGRDPAVRYYGGRSWNVVEDQGRHVLGGATIPHAGAVAAADAAVPDFVVKPGVVVSLAVTVEGTSEQQERIKAAIAAQLKESGINVADNSPVKLIARTEQGQTRQQSYEVRENGRPRAPWDREVKTVSVTEKITRIFFEVDGKVAWESRTSSSAPMFVTMKEGQTVDQAVQGSVGFNMAFLEAVRVPAYVPRVTGDTPWLGESAWTINGIGKDRLLDKPNVPAAAAAPVGNVDGLE